MKLENKQMYLVFGGFLGFGRLCGGSWELSCARFVAVRGILCDLGSIGLRNSLDVVPYGSKWLASLNKFVCFLFALVVAWLFLYFVLLLSCLSICMSVCLSVYLSGCRSVWCRLVLFVLALREAAFLYDLRMESQLNDTIMTKM